MPHLRELFRMILSDIATYSMKRSTRSLCATAELLVYIPCSYLLKYKVNPIKNII